MNEIEQNVHTAVKKRDRAELYSTRVKVVMCLSVCPYVCLSLVTIDRQTDTVARSADGDRDG